MVWIQVRTWVHIVSKGYQHTSKVAIGMHNGAMMANAPQLSSINVTPSKCFSQEQPKYNRGI